MSNEYRGNGFWYFLAGTVVGATLGVLYAPRAGEETREDIADWLKERRSKGTELIHRVKEESLAKKEALVAAARAAKSTYSDVNAKHHDVVA